MTQDSFDELRKALREKTPPRTGPKEEPFGAAMDYPASDHADPQQMFPPEELLVANESDVQVMPKGVSSSMEYTGVSSFALIGADFDDEDEEGDFVQTFPKPQTWRNSHYREFIRHHACASCGREESEDLSIICAHISLKNTGQGMKAPDWASIPLCAICHSNDHAGHGMSKEEKLEAMVRCMGEWIEDWDDYDEDEEES